MTDRLARDYHRSVGEFQSDFEPYSRRSAVEHARRYVTRLIALKEFRPGDRLPSAAAIGAEIGVSRPVVLDALKILEGEGRIRVGPGAAGARVLDAQGPQQSAMRAWMTENHQTITQMAYLREMVEPGAARFAAIKGISAALARRAKGIIEDMQSIGDGNRQDQLGLDTDFHQFVGDATGMPVLKELMGTCRTWVAPVFDLLDWPDSRRIVSSTNEHRRILQAIIDRDPDEAAAAAFHHVQASTGLIVAKMKELASKRTEPKKVAL